MLKAYYFLWRRDGMTRDEFIDYYEKSHIDLILDNLPRAKDFRRNYPVWQAGHTEYLGSPLFDVLTGITYDSRTTFEASLDVYHSSPFSEIVTEDELRFINRARMKFMPVDEVIDHLPEDQWQPAPVVAEGAKLLRLTRRPAELDPSEFRRFYEASETPAIRPLINGCVDYRRNYVRWSDPLNFMTDELRAEIDSLGLIGCDLVEEFCFADTVSAATAALTLDGAPAHSQPMTGMLCTPVIGCTQHLRAT